MKIYYLFVCCCLLAFPAFSATCTYGDPSGSVFDGNCGSVGANNCFPVSLSSTSDPLAASVSFTAYITSHGGGGNTFSTLGAPPSGWEVVNSGQYGVAYVVNGSPDGLYIPWNCDGDPYAISPSAPTISPGSLDFGIVTNPYTVSQSFDLTCQNSCTCSVSSGSIPIGSSYNADCTSLTGDLSVDGDYSWSVTYTDTTNSLFTVYDYTMSVPVVGSLGGLLGTIYSDLGIDGSLLQLAIAPLISLVLALAVFPFLLYGYRLIRRFIK